MTQVQKIAEKEHQSSYYVCSHYYERICMFKKVEENLMMIEIEDIEKGPK